MAGRRVHTDEEVDRILLQVVALVDECNPPAELRDWSAKACWNALQMPVEIRNTEQAVTDIRKAMQMAERISPFGELGVTLADFALRMVSAREHLVHVPRTPGADSPH